MDRYGRGHAYVGRGAVCRIRLALVRSTPGGAFHDPAATYEPPFGGNVRLRDTGGMWFELDGDAHSHTDACTDTDADADRDAGCTAITTGRLLWIGKRRRLVDAIPLRPGRSHRALAGRACLRRPRRTQRASPTTTTDGPRPRASILVTFDLFAERARALGWGRGRTRPLKSFGGDSSLGARYGMPTNRRWRSSPRRCRPPPTGAARRVSTMRPWWSEAPSRCCRRCARRARGTGAFSAPIDHRGGSGQPDGGISITMRSACSPWSSQSRSASIALTTSAAPPSASSHRNSG